jgi:phage gp46-like protein
MPDIRLIDIMTPDVVTFDWLKLPTGLVDETQQLADAIMVALNTDARADESEVLPDPRDDDRRGWWGDVDAKKLWNGWEIGSKLWLLRRAKIVDNGAREGATLTRVEAYIRNALQPFIDQSICSRISVVARQDNQERILATIIVYRGPKAAIQLQYQPLWQELFPGS